MTLPLISLFHVKAQLIPEVEEEEVRVIAGVAIPRLSFDATYIMISDGYNIMRSEP